MKSEKNAYAETRSSKLADYQLEDGAIVTFDTSDSLPKEIKKALVKIPTKEEARFLVDIYYQTQDRRIAVEGQLRSLGQGKDTRSKKSQNNEENESFMIWYASKLRNMEDAIKKALEAFSDSYYISRWAKSVIGIGPVIATCLAAYLDIRPGMHAGNWWSYFGLNDNNRPWLGREKSKEIVNRCIEENGGILDDTAVYAISNATKWSMEYLEEKGKVKKGKNKGVWSKDELTKACSYIPYNRTLKVVAFKIGHSFRMCKNKPNSLYGRLLAEREAYENKKNLAGDYADQAYRILKEKNIGKDTVAYSYYSKGQLPPAHIAQRSERWATKMFISHLFEAMYYNAYGKRCPEPYIIGFAENGHNDYIEPEVAYESVARDVV